MYSYYGRWVPHKTRFTQRVSVRVTVDRTGTHKRTKCSAISKCTRRIANCKQTSPIFRVRVWLSAKKNHTVRFSIKFPSRIVREATKTEHFLFLTYPAFWWPTWFLTPDGSGVRDVSTACQKIQTEWKNTIPHFCNTTPLLKRIKLVVNTTQIPVKSSHWLAAAFLLSPEMQLCASVA